MMLATEIAQHWRAQSACCPQCFGAPPVPALAQPDDKRADSMLGLDDAMASVGP